MSQSATDKPLNDDEIAPKDVQNQNSTMPEDQNIGLTEPAISPSILDDCVLTENANPILFIK